LCAHPLLSQAGKKIPQLTEEESMKAHGECSCFRPSALCFLASLPLESACNWNGIYHEGEEWYQPNANSSTAMDSGYR
jgi:hypothetical protein